MNFSDFKKKYFSCLLKNAIQNSADFEGLQKELKSFKYHFDNNIGEKSYLDITKIPTEWVEYGTVYRYTFKNPTQKNFNISFLILEANSRLKYHLTDNNVIHYFLNKKINIFNKGELCELCNNNEKAPIFTLSIDF